jgi:hypothetical protein
VTAVAVVTVMTAALVETLVVLMSVVVTVGKL